jgi:hypothetical protein
MKKVKACFFCKREVDLNENHFLIKGPDGKSHAVHDHVGVSEHGGVEVNIEDSEKE